MSEDLLTLTPPSADERVRYGAAPSQFADLRLPSGAGPHPVVVCIHGGFWRARYDLVHLGHLCAALTARGYATWSVEYRRLGEEGGGYPGSCEDIVASVLALKDIAFARHLDVSRLVLLGHSAGGHLALVAAKALRPRGVVALAPVADLAEASRLGLSSGVADEFVGGASLGAVSPAHRLPVGVPQWVLHGANDADVPVSMSRAYVQAAKAAGDRAVLVERAGEGHYEPIDPRSAAFEAVLASVREASGNV